MKQKQSMHKCVSLFLCYLVLSLTFFSAFSMRAEATFSATVLGQDNVPGFRRVNDTTSITVVSDYDFVTLLPPSGTEGLALSCSPLPDSYLYRCTYTFALQEQEPREYTLRVQPGNDPVELVSYAVDDLSPEFSDVTFSQAPGAVSVSYTLRDRAYPGSSSCPGIDLVRLLLNDDPIHEESFGSSCEETGLFTASFPDFQGDAELFLEARDRLGNTGLSSVHRLTLDTLAPSLPSTFLLLRGGAPLTKLSNSSITDITVDLNFTIVESHLATVTVDASQLNPAYASVPVTCVGTGSSNKCQLSDLILRPDEERITITITAVDESGNRAIGEATVLLDIVNTAPEILSIGRADTTCETCFLRDGKNPLLLKVDAPGGLVTNAIGLRLGTRALPPVNCTRVNGDIHNCVVEAIPPSARDGDSLLLRVLPTSMDDLGNQVRGILEKEFIIDNQEPRLLEDPSFDVACPTAGQQLRLTAVARDELSPFLLLGANVSKITDRDTIETTCQQRLDAPTDHDCVLTIDSFVSINTEADIPLYLSDAAGNKVEMELQNFEVCEANTEVTPNVITSLKPSISPLPSVDKLVASMIKYRLLLPLELTLADPEVDIIQVPRVTCDGLFTPGPSYVMNEFSSSPMLVTHFYSQGLWPNETVDLNCTLDFTIRRGNVVYLQQEQEQLNLALPVTRMERGLPGQAVLDKRNNLVAEINAMQRSIDGKASIDNSLGELCRMAEKVAMVPGVLASIETVIAPIALATWPIGGEAAWAGIVSTFTPVMESIYTYVWPADWIPSNFGGPQLIGYFVKWTCSIYSCALYNANTWSSFSMEMLEGNRIMPEDPASVVSGLPKQGAKEGDKLILDDGSVWLYENDAWSGVLGPIETEYYIDDPSEMHGRVDTDHALADSKTAATFLAENKGDYTYTIDRDPNAGAFYRDLATGVITGDDWVVNPYRSARYDALCLPAQLYNLRKEKQLKCIALQCIDEMATTGLPITQCEQKYAAQHCLYVESAQARTHGSFSEIIVNMFTSVAMQVLVGVGTQWAMATTCKPLYNAMNGLATSSPTSYCSSAPSMGGMGDWLQGHCVVVATACSVSLGAMALENLQRIMSEGLRMDNPSVLEGEDFCAGIDGVEPDESSEGGLF
jgi:hypothetical protein